MLGSSAVLAAWSARRPRAKGPRPRPAPRPRRPPVDDVVPPEAKVHRWLALAAILLAGACLSVWSAHQERLGTGALISMLGFGAIGVVLWAVAWRSTPLRGEVNPSPPAVFVLTGIGLLASCVLGFGFPLRTPRDTD